MRRATGEDQKCTTDPGGASFGPDRARRYMFLLILGWSAVVGVSVVCNLLQIRHEAVLEARAVADATFNKDVVFRRWAAGHGGVYVPATDATPPNPNLSHIGERDVETPSGRKLTLVNPAYMIRQLHELSREQYGVRGHITSLDPIRPENAPDAWEKEALEVFERGDVEASSVQEIDDTPFVRFMRPLVTEERCLKCHATQGYEVGDIRGGVSVSVPMTSYWANVQPHAVPLLGGHIVFWILGLIGIRGGGRSILRHGGARTHAETARREAEEAAVREQNLLRTLLDVSLDHIFFKDADGRFTRANSSLARWVGLDHAEDISGKTDFDMFSDAELARDTLAEEQEIMRTGHPIVGKIEKAARADGRVMWQSITKVPLPGPDGSIVGTFGIGRDVTDQMHREEALRRANAQLAQSNRELSEFAYVASHDLQEPLRKILAFGDLLRNSAGDGLGHEGEDCLERMHNAARRMQRLVNDLLSLSRVTTRAEPFELVDLTTVARGAVKDLSSRIEDTNADVEIGDLPRVNADRAQMRRLLQHLVGNALKFTVAGRDPQIGIHARLAASAPRKSETSVPSGCVSDDEPICQFVVEDNGTGFDEKYLSRIFRPFERLYGRTDYEGTGMGLAICRKIVERHRGSITAESVPGEGSTFIVALPAEQSEELLGRHDP